MFILCVFPPGRSSRTDHSSTGANGGVNTVSHSHAMVANGYICKDCSIHSERKEALTTYSSPSSSQVASAAAAASAFSSSSSSSQAASAAAAAATTLSSSSSSSQAASAAAVYTERSRVRGARLVRTLPSVHTTDWGVKLGCVH